MTRGLLLLVLLAFPVAAQTAQPGPSNPLGVETGALLGAPEGQPLRGDDLKRQTEEIAEQIRCPMCRGLPISASPTDSAAAMRAEATELLSKGYTQQQVIDFFESTYGEFVLLDPKTEGNLPLFIAPFVLLGVGAFVIFWRLRQGNDPVAEEEEPELADYAARVRQEVAAGEET